MFPAKARPAPMLAGLTLLTVGVERLVNAYLIAPITGNGATPLVIGIVCVFGGMVLVAASLLPGPRSKE